MTSLTQDCSICYGPLGSYHLAVHPEQKTEDLKHIFHRSCLERWMQHNSSCPMCRKTIVELEPREVIRQREHALIDAALKGDLETIKSVHNMGFVSAMVKSQAVADAMFTGNKDVVMYMIQKNHHSESFLKSCLLNAAANCDLDVYEAISNHMRITQADREICVIQAACHGHLSFIEKMFELGPIGEEALGGACIAAIDHIYSDLVPLLLQHGHIPYLSRNAAVLKLAQRDDFYLVDFLLNTGPISDVAKVRVIAYARLHGNHDFANNLERQLPIFAETYEEAMMLALRDRWYKEAIYYVKDNKLSKRSLQHLLEVFVQRNEPLMLDDLLKFAYFPYKELSSAKLQALTLHHDQVAQVINDAMKNFLKRMFQRAFCLRR